MDDLLERLKDAKTTVSGAVVAFLALAKELGYEIVIPQNKIETYALVIVAIGLLLSGGKKK